MNPRQWKAVVFDLDSTLCSYVLTVGEVVANALDRIGESRTLLDPLNGTVDRYNHLWLKLEVQANSAQATRKRVWEIVFRERGADDPALCERFAEAYSQIRKESGVRLFPGVETLLETLGRNVRLGLLTNGPSDMQWEKIHALGIEQRFDALLVAGDAGIYKPDPRIFRILLDRLETEPGDALFVGDSYPSDILGAHAAGMITAWIRSNGASPPKPPPVHNFTLQAATDLLEVL